MSGTTLLLIWDVAMSLHQINRPHLQQLSCNRSVCLQVLPQLLDLLLELFSPGVVLLAEGLLLLTAQGGKVGVPLKGAEQEGGGAEVAELYIHRTQIPRVGRKQTACCGYFNSLLCFLEQSIKSCFAVSSCGSHFGPTKAQE